VEQIVKHLFNNVVTLAKKTMNVLKHINMSNRKVFSLMLLNMTGDEAIRITDGQDCVLPKVMVHTAYIVKWEQNQSA